jgi:hypothetical protein
MKPRSSRLILAGVVALLAGAAWLFLGHPPPTSQRLADGSTVSLLGVTYGRKHLMVYGPFWQRAFARLLPENVSRRLGFQFLSHTTTNESLMVWTEMSNRSIPPGSPLLFQPASVVLSDGQGTEFCETSSQEAEHFPNRAIKGISFPIVPRGSNRLRILVAPYKQEGAVKQVAVFNVPNPAPRLRQTWQASPLPVEANAGDLKFTLTQLKPWQREETSSAGINTETRMSAKYQFAEGGKTSTNWCVAKVEILDEAGGYQQPPITSYGFNLTRGRYEFRAGLGTSAVWKLRFTLLRVGGFTSNEIALIQRLPMPARGAGPSEPIALKVGGMDLSVYCEVHKEDFSSLVARLDAPAEEVELMALRIVDQHGTNIGPPFPSLAHNKGGSLWVLHPRQDSESINATLAVCRVRYVELLVRPEPPFKYSPSTFPASGK